ncbi:MAG: nucleotide exchange factor GrpE [Candidatus Liptonbacteria bacterium]|nr:nucleotide exchange factor GrpE [Candidatus Liptonbacteria bacterium]
MTEEIKKEIPNGESELDKCKKEKEEYLAGWQRAKADFINYKKEEAKRFEDIAKYASATLLEELITVLDNFDLAIQALKKAGGVDKGIYMIRAHLEDILRKRGLTRIELTPPAQFDASTMEAIEETSSAESPGTVLEEIAPGYRLHDKVIRPARVRISKGK